MVSLKKIEKAKNLAKILTDKKNFSLIKFTNISHQKLETLRKQLKEKQAGLTVIKNAFFEKAVESLTSLNENFSQIKEKFFPLKENSALLTFDGE
jgi:ribosomal protein L10